MRVKELNVLLKKLERQGWKVEKGRKHVMAYPPDKSKSPVSISTTPTDHRAWDNTIAFCKQRGAEL